MRSTLRKAYYRGSYQTRIGAKLNYVEAVAKDGSNDVISPTTETIGGVDYTFHTFISGSNTLEVTKGGSVDILIVGGGGGGGRQHAAGGGGGGVLFKLAENLSVGTYNITVGEGGAGASVVPGNGGNGQDSVFNNFTAKGGGGGGSGATAGLDGGSGGGAGGSGTSTNSGGSGEPGQGYSGGANFAGTNRPGGGGGGAGGIGQAAPNVTTAGNGGIGLDIWGNGYGGGGGGSTYDGGTAGTASHGGGDGGAGSTDTKNDGIPATANTGGGGGGGNRAGALIGSGGQGGSGVVIVRYKKKIDYNIFLVAGQSNTDGRVDTTDVNAPDYLSDNKVGGVKVWNGSSIVDYDLTDIGESGNGSSWVLEQTSGKYSFAHVALKKIAETMKNVLVVQVTSGGTPLAAVSNTRGSWNHNYAAIPDDGTPKLLQEFNNRFDSLAAYLNANNKSFEIRGMLWHQGEWDDDTKYNDEANYYTNFTELISTVRSFTGKSDLPIIFGTIDNESAAYSPTIRTAQLQVASEDSDAYCRDNDDLSIYDTFHFDANSCNTFGEWCATQYLNNYT